MAQTIPLHLVLDLGTGSEFFDSVADSDQDIVYPWPGDPYTLDLTTPIQLIQPVWIGVSADGNNAQAFPKSMTVAQIIAAGFPRVYEGTEIVDGDGNVLVFSDQYNHILLAIAACCNPNYLTQALALKTSNKPLTPGQTYVCGTEAIFKWLALYGKNELRPDLTYEFRIRMINADASIDLEDALVPTAPFSETHANVLNWPADFVGLTIEGENLVANDTVSPMPGELRLLTFDGGTLEMHVIIRDNAAAIIAEDTQIFALPDSQCGTGCIDPYPENILTSFPDATLDVAYNHSTQLEGTGPFAFNILQKPTWLAGVLDPVTGLITWSGTPDTPENELIVEFQAENCGEPIAEETPSSGEILFDVKQVLSFTARTPISNQPWYKVVWADFLGLFVAITQQDGSGTQVATSPDGETWTLRSTPGDINWNSITVNESAGKLVVVGTGDVGAIMTSADAITWTPHNAPEVVQARAVVYSPELDLYISVGSLGTNRIMKSSDGETWTPVVAPVLNQWYGLVWSSALGLFVATAATGTGNQVMTSPDGDTWTIRTTDGTSRSWFSISEGGGLLIATSTTGSFGQRIMTSPDAITWTLRTASNFNRNWTGNAYGNGVFVAVGNGTGPSVMQSVDGISWIDTTAPNSPWTGIAYNGTTRFVVVGLNALATADWT